MYFFKYFKPGLVERNMLRRGEVFFASRSELNDANEFQCRFILKGSLDHWSRLAEYILTKVSWEIEAHSPAPKEVTKVLRALADELGRLLKKKSGTRDLPLEVLGTYAAEVLEQSIVKFFGDHNGQLILGVLRNFCDKQLEVLLHSPRYVTSFSLDGANPTLWGHYGGAEKGFALIYESPRPELKVYSPIKILHGVRIRDDGINELGIYDSDSLPLEPVKYRTTPPKVNAFRDLSRQFFYSDEEYHYDVPEEYAGSADRKEEALLGVVKYSGWRYEREIRAFMPVYKQLQPALRVLRVAGEHLRGLIFGAKMSENDKADLTHCCHLMRESAPATEKNEARHLPDFAFFQAKTIASRFAVVFEPVGVLGTKTHGFSMPMITVDELPADVLQSLRDVATQMSNPSKWVQPEVENSGNNETSLRAD